MYTPVCVCASSREELRVCYVKEEKGGSDGRVIRGRRALATAAGPAQRSENTHQPTSER